MRPASGRPGDPPGARSGAGQRLASWSSRFDAMSPDTQRRLRLALIVPRTPFLCYLKDHRLVRLMTWLDPNRDANVAWLMIQGTLSFDSTTSLFTLFSRVN